MFLGSNSNYHDGMLSEVHLYILFETRTKTNWCRLNLWWYIRIFDYDTLDSSMMMIQLTLRWWYIRLCNDDTLDCYLDTWCGFEAAKTAPWPNRGLHHFGKFLEPSDEWAGRGCYCFLMRWHSWAFLADQEWAIETCRAQIWNFQF